MHIKLRYEYPECHLLTIPAVYSICDGSLYDKAGESLEEGENWYEY